MIKAFVASSGKNVDFVSKTFAGGEVNPRIETYPVPHGDYFPHGKEVSMMAALYSSEDIMEMYMAVNALHQQRCQVSLIIPYFPFARQDRVCNPGEAFSLSAFVDLIRSMRNVWQVITWDVHNYEKTRELFMPPREAGLRTIDYRNVQASQFVKHLYVGGKPEKPVMIVAPDKGALDRANQCAQAIEAIGVVHATKVRTSNGVESSLPEGLNLGDVDVLIVDDICDGGRTFIGLGQKLKKVTTGKVNLFVTHGIFSYGNSPFRGAIDEIYCANIFPRKGPETFFCDDAPTVRHIDITKPSR